MQGRRIFSGENGRVRMETRKLGRGGRPRAWRPGNAPEPGRAEPMSAAGWTQRLTEATKAGLSSMILIDVRLTPFQIMAINGEK